MKVTLDVLKAKQACENQVVLFAQTFGSEVEVTLATCLQAKQEGIDLNWAINNLFNTEQKTHYDEAIKPHRNIYNQTYISLRNMFCNLRQPIWDIYMIPPNQLPSEFEIAIKPILDAYNEALIPAKYYYNEAIAEAFYNASQI